MSPLPAKPPKPSSMSPPPAMPPKPSSMRKGKAPPAPQLMAGQPEQTKYAHALQRIQALRSAQERQGRDAMRTATAEAVAASSREGQAQFHLSWA